MTQKEIAKQLNISQATVSMALKGSERISPAVREAVRRLAADIGYRPNPAGQMLRLGRSNVIGAVFPSLTSSLTATCSTSSRQAAMRKPHRPPPRFRACG